MTTIELLNATPEMLDNATRRMTAFRNWADMCRSMKQDGYVPTLRDDDRAAPEPADKDAVRMLRYAANRAGFHWVA